MTDELATLVEELERTDLPGDGAPTFEAPWQARAFATAVTLHREGFFTWETFRKRLADAVDVDVEPAPDGDFEDAYYRQWIAALEAVIESKGVVTAEEIELRTAEFATGERDASEFVEGHEHARGQPHEYARRRPPDHDHGHDH